MEVTSACTWERLEKVRRCRTSRIDCIVPIQLGCPMSNSVHDCCYQRLFLSHAIASFAMDTVRLVAVEPRKLRRLFFNYFNWVLIALRRRARSSKFPLHITSSPAWHQCSFGALRRQLHDSWCFLIINFTTLCCQMDEHADWQQQTRPLSTAPNYNDIPRLRLSLFGRFA